MMKSLMPLWVLLVALVGASPLGAPARQNVTVPSIVGRFELLHLPGSGRVPTGLALVNDRLYVANNGSDNLAVILNDRVSKFIETAPTPTAITSDPVRNRIYVGTSITPTLALYENDTLIKREQLPGRINTLLAHGDDLFVGLDNEAILERRDADTLEKKRELKLTRGFNVEWLAVDATRGRLYASVYESVAALDLNTLQELFWMDAPYHTGPFAINPKDGSLWMDAYDEDTNKSYILGFMPDGRELARVSLESSASTATLDDVGRLYVLDSWLNQVYVFDTQTQKVIATLPVNEGAREALFDPRARAVYVANSDTDNLTVIDVDALRVRATIPLAVSVNALLAAPEAGRVYAANGSTNSVFVIDGQQVVREIPVGNNPVDLARDPETQRLFVATRADGALSIIDEKNLQVTATNVITFYLQTVATDPVHRKLFASSLEFTLDTMQSSAVYLAQGITIGSLNRSVYTRVNPALEKIYSVAYNGVPGSNSRNTLYAFHYDQPAESKSLGSRTGGNTTALAIDPTTNNVYAASTHPLAYTHGLDVFDGNDNLVFSLPLDSRTRGIAVNPATHHVFLSHSNTYSPYTRLIPPHDNTVEILDTRSLGRVAYLDVPSAPDAMTLLGNMLYVAGSSDGVITVIQDAASEPPPAPTATLTPSPYPTWTPTVTQMPVVVDTATPSAITNTLSAPTCAIEIDLALKAKAQAVGTNSLGCPATPAVTSGQFAYQPFAKGFLIDDFRDQNAKKVYAFFADGTFQVMADTWREGDPESMCPEVPVESGPARPKRGFGKVWCENAAVRQLGGGLQEERAIEVVMQSFERGTMFLLGGVGDYVLYEDGTWK